MGNSLIPTYLAFIVGLFAAGISQAGTMTSPDGQVAVSVFVNEGDVLCYSVKWKSEDIVEPSPLGVTVDGVDFGKRVSIGSPTMSSVDETYATRGVHHLARNHFHSWLYPITHLDSGRQCDLEFRVYDDAVAVRYTVRGEGTQHVDRESSSWKLMDGATAWYFERLTKGWKLKSYAGEWLSTDVGELHRVSPVGPIQGTPIILELPRQIGYAVITKAATYNYSGMRLRATSNRTLVADFTEGEKGFDVEGTIVTPWRVTMLADDLNELVNSDLIKNLNPPPDAKLFTDVDYIKSGRTVWSWETLGLGDPTTQRRFIDLAAEMGFEYTTIDDGWKNWDAPWDTIGKLCKHAHEMGVGVWLWVHSADIMDPANDYQQMRMYFAQVAEVGAVGLKIDFMNGESKELVDFEVAVLQNAAKYRLMINFHGCHASTGEERTYPNEMTREGIRGIEVNKMKEGPLPASHNAALPFTRFVVGHADYTPVLFSNPGPTTWAHQAATLVLFTSGLQTYAEHPDTMMRHPILKDAFTVISDIPAVWDETRVLPGSQIGKLAVMARRRDQDWFVGILNGEQATKGYSLSPSFLDEGQYKMEIVCDDLQRRGVDLVGMNPKAVLHEFTTAVPLRVETRASRRGQDVLVQLAPGGGYVARFTKVVN
ncbi:glycoside hydrolase family 97 protein [Aporhodopirellula aestuarii]|uniref:Glycoside hydrolase family 97 protein n=1 Tax=Aporhodopirellula aestuarii TaxID=2950107 RepID=A0ABT0U9K9_9BACT|nr:glycoside hydrolase family 97 protein [Aporhodopirellula aestuarii]MCM2373561.1 glycoside hydrolase family 97 protein [Aporhodopirellula aestuarii]